MEELLKAIYEEFKMIHDRVYLEYNLTDRPSYPYAVYKYSSEGLNRNQEGFYIDLDIFGNSSNTLEIEELAHKFKRELDGKTIINCDNLLQFKFMNSAIIPTEHKEIRRRWLEIYIKVDWRS